jgi:hypothetical protein
MYPGDDVGQVSFRDIDDHEVTIQRFRGLTAVLVGGGRGSIREAVRWGNALDRRLHALPGVQVVPVAFLERLPGFVPRKLVRESIKRLAPVEALIDWDGSAASALGCTDPDFAHIFIIDPSSVLRHRVIRAFSEADAAHAAELAMALRRVA